MNSTVPATPSKNPFINPPNSNNPFLRKPSAGQTSTSDSEDASVIDAAQRYPQLPPEPPAGVRQASPPLPPIPPHPTGMVLTPMPPVMPTQVPPLVSPPPLPARRPTQPVPAETPTTPSIRQQPQQQPILEVNSEPVRNPDNMTDEEALAAAIQASLNLVDGPVFTPPPGPPPGRSSSSPATPQPTRRTSPPAPVEAQPTGASSTPSNPPPPFELEPPPYTPSPDAYTETTVEVGPRRPFQNPTRAQPPRVPGGYPGSVSRQRTGASSADLGTSWRADVTIPPSDSGPYLAPQATGWSARSNSQPDLTLLDSSSSTGGSFSPPPGPPSSRSTAPRNSETSEDDGKPTTSPTPGRPLLNKGKTLVYPPGYFCHKCNNTGYKSFDPSNPCSKCWSKYARDYSGPLTGLCHAPSDPVPPRSPFNEASRALVLRGAPDLESPTDLLVARAASPKAASLWRLPAKLRARLPGVWDSLLPGPS
ncbi:hypothetical protein FRC04_008548 [Tulasnella sp. 424]|nr:hypothetical protein FRC04_008548 [Tulasnella sp. 424]